MKQKGFAPLIILLVIAIIGVVGYFGYKTYKQNASTETAATPTSNSTNEFNTSVSPLSATVASPPAVITQNTKTPTPTAKPTAKPTTVPTITPTPTPIINNICEIVIEPDTTTTTSVNLVAGVTSKNGSYITGTRWDFDGNGTWDTDINVLNESINHSYSNGAHTVNLQLKMSDGSITPTCSKTFTTPNGFTVTLSGIVYQDDNCNNVYDSSEKTLAGVTVKIINMNGLGNLASLTTDQNGNYVFNYVLANSDSITMQPYAYPLDDSSYGVVNEPQAVTLNAGTNHTRIDIGEVPAPVGDHCH
jgi:hypothetical protein